MMSLKKKSKLFIKFHLLYLNNLKFLSAKLI